MNKGVQLTEVALKGKQALIYDNCLPLDVFQKMKKVLLNLGFPWGYCSNITPQRSKIKSPIDGYDNDDAYQFTHHFLPFQGFGWSNWTKLIMPILNVFNAKAWIRVKANLGTREPKPLVHGWHYDVCDTVPFVDSYTAVLYMNTNNGYTLMETGDKVESVENRLVLFPNDILHTGIRQTDTRVRVLLNFNFFQ